MSRSLKVAAAQMGPVQLADTRADVVVRLIAMLREAHASGCTLVVFPELALTTFFPRYFMESQNDIDAYFEREMPNAATQPLFDEARRLGIGFHLGYAELTEENGETRHYNTAILVGTDGSIIGKYRKIHLPGHAERLHGTPYQHLEKRYFDPGKLGFRVWRAFDGIIGMCICNDRRWPETFRVLGLQGVEMVVLGYNTPESNIYHRQPAHQKMLQHRLCVQAAAYQNSTWVVATAKAGFEDGHALIGGTIIAAPTGEIAAQAVSEDDEVVVYDCDLDVGNDFKRNIFAFEKHRRIEHYGLITSQTGVVPPPE
jgi:predicted amidohydrolase